jgi:CheY-like chemotaxis protein
MEEKRSRRENLIRVQMPYGKVLVVDDVQTNLDVARGLMLPYGLTIDCVTSGKAAIEKIRHGSVRYDAIFMDHMMPEMDGIEAARIIREEIGTEYAKTVPIIALTANAISGNEEMFLQHGFNAFISKPIDLMRLDTLLKQWVRDKQSEDILRVAESFVQEESSSESGGAELLDNVLIKGVDIEKGISHFGNEKTYLDILHSYSQHTPALLDKLAALTRETLKDYAVTVHGLKSASYGIFAEEIGMQAAELEALSKAKNYDAVYERNDYFIQNTRILLGAIAETLASIFPHTNSSKETKASIDPKILSKISDAASRYKNALLEEAMNELEHYSYEKESDAELVIWLREQIDNLEYDEICKKIKTAVPDKDSA